MVDTRPTNSAWQQRTAASLIACAILALLLARNYLIAEQAIFVIVGALGMVGLLAPALGTRPLFGFIAALCCAALVMLALILLLRQINSAQILASHLNAAALCVGISLVGWARLAAAGPRLRVSEWAITLQAGIAILVLIGWYFNSALIVQGATQRVPMQFNSAICHLLSAIWLWRALRGPARYAMLSSIPIVIFSVAALFEENGNLELGLDELLWTHPIVVAGVPAGHMASITALTFLLGVVALLVLSRAGRNNRALIVVWTCGLAICISAFMALAGYALDVPQASALGSQTPMALLTSLAFCGQGVALVFVGHEHVDRNQHQTYWLPILVIAGSIVLAEQLGRAVTEQRLAVAKQVTQLRADTVQSAISRGMSIQLAALARMAERLSLVEASATDSLFETDARLLFKDFPDLQVLALLGPDQRLRRIFRRNAMHPTTLPEWPFELDAQRLLAINAVANTGKAQLSAPVVLIGNQLGSVFVMPLLRTDGALSGAAYLSAAIPFSIVQEQLLIDGANIPLQVWDGASLVINKGPPGQGEPIRRAIKLPGRIWELRIWDAPPALDRISWALTLGAVVAGLGLAQALRYAGLAASRARKSEATSAKLRRLSELAISLSGEHSTRSAQQIAEQLRDILNAQQATLAIRAAGTGHPEVMAVARSEQSERDHSKTVSVDAIKVLLEEPKRALRMSLAQLQAHPNWAKTAASGAMPAAGLLAAPLIGADDSSVGMLFLCDRRGGDFDADDEAICVQVAQLAAAAIERHRLVTRLQERDRFFEMALEPFCILNADVTHFVQVNPAFVRLLGYPEAELLSRGFMEFVVPDDHAATAEITRDVVDRRAIKDFVNRYRCADGSLVTLEWDSVKNAHGTVYAVARNITERLRGEKALSQAAEDLRSRNRELQDFAFVASHDLQEPLRKIRAFGERVERHALDLNDAARDDLARMNAAAARMQTLIEDLLAFSQVSSRGKPFVRVDLNVIVAVVLEDLSERVLSTHARIDVAVLPCVDGDATQLRQIMQNLIGNALKFCAVDRPPVIGIRARPTELRGKLAYAMTVEDNGIGFDVKHRERIFAPFQRLHSRDEYSGTGIGLAIVRRIVQRHQGRIDADGKLGIGATFTLILPERQSVAQPMLNNTDRASDQGL